MNTAKYSTFFVALLATSIIGSSSTASAQKKAVLDSYAQPGAAPISDTVNEWAPVSSPHVTLGDLALVVHNDALLIALAGDGQADHEDLLSIIETGRITNTFARKYSHFVFVQLSSKFIAFTNAKSARGALQQLKNGQPITPRKNMITGSLGNVASNSSITGLLSKDATLLDVVNGFAVLGKYSEPSREVTYLGFGSLESGKAFIASDGYGIYQSNNGVREAQRTGLLRFGPMPIITGE